MDVVVMRCLVKYLTSLWQLDSFINHLVNYPLALINKIKMREGLMSLKGKSLMVRVL